jgi:hypothetical protein
MWKKILIWAIGIIIALPSILFGTYIYRGGDVGDISIDKIMLSLFGDNNDHSTTYQYEYNAAPEPEFKREKIKTLSKKQGEEYYTEVPFYVNAPYAENVRVLIYAPTATNVNFSPAKGYSLSLNSGIAQHPLGWAIADINNPKGKFLAKIKTLESIKEEDIIVKHVFDIDFTKPMDLITLKVK